jgi:hypothetical protein
VLPCPEPFDRRAPPLQPACSFEDSHGSLASGCDKMTYVCGHPGCQLAADGDLLRAFHRTSAPVQQSCALRHVQRERQGLGPCRRLPCGLAETLVRGAGRHRDGGFVLDVV